MIVVVIMLVIWRFGLWNESSDLCRMTQQHTLADVRICKRSDPNWVISNTSLCEISQYDLSLFKIISQHFLLKISSYDLGYVYVRCVRCLRIRLHMIWNLWYKIHCSTMPWSTFIYETNTFCPLLNTIVSMSMIRVLTIFSFALRTPILPKRTWNGDDLKVPSSCSTTTTSIAPVRVDPLISE